MPFVVSDIMDGSASLLNDSEKTVFNYNVQLPYFKIALEDLRQELLDNNIPITTKSSAILNIPKGVNNIGGTVALGYPSVGPPLPVDLVDVIALWEKSADNPDGDFSFITRVAFLTRYNYVTAHPAEWSWNNQIIKFNPSTEALSMTIDYVGDPLIPVTDETSTVRVFNSTNFLKYRNAALCAEFIGENKERADSLNVNALRAMESLLSVAIKSSQALATRRKRFRR